MSNFTPGMWWIAPPIFDGDAIFAPAQEKGRRNEVVAMGILNKHDARLIAAAPKLYHALKFYYEAMRHTRPDLAFVASKVLAEVDGTEEQS